MKKILTIVSFVLATASPALSQVHPCDMPVPPQPQIVTVNVPFTLAWCHNLKDATGSDVSITGWKLIRDSDAPVTINATATATRNAAGLMGYSVGRIETVAGSHTYQVYGVNGAADGAKAAITFTVQVGTLTAPTGVRVIP